MEKPSPPEGGGKEAIAAENDRVRRNLLNWQPDAHVVMTRGVAHDPNQLEVLQSIATFEHFAPDNDPYGEHDFGCVEVCNERYFFKIDYYADERLDAGAEDPAKTCFRVLTVMRADEY